MEDSPGKAHLISVSLVGKARAGDVDLIFLSNVTLRLLA